MEVIGDVAFFTQGAKLLSLELESHKIKSHLAHTDEITCLTQASSVLYSGGRDGCIVKWSLPSLTSYKISSSIKLLAASPEALFFLKANTLLLYKLDLGSETYSQMPFFKGFLEDSITLKFTFDYSALVLLTERSVIMQNILTQSSRVFNHSAPLTVLALHPTGKYIAVGDYSGQIIKVYEKFNTKLHWHSHKVTSLTFTPDSNYLISGGEEGVAVLWHESTGEKTYLPRLGCGLSNIAVNLENNFYVIKLVTGAVKVFRTSDYKQIGGYSCLINPQKLIPKSKLFTGMVWNQNRLIMNAAPGCIQFYDPETGEVRALDCESRNPISRSNEDYPCPLEIVQVAFVNEFMATLLRSDSDYLNVSLLKFWKNEKIHTLVMHPQSDSAHSLLAHNNGFVTLGGNSFVLWQEQGKWTGCVERKHGGLKCLAACSMGDLYVSFSHIVTQWDDKMQCSKELFEPNGNDIIFLQHTTSEIIAGTQGEIHVFSEGLIIWSLELAYIHGIIAENKHFIVALNASKYTPSQIRSCKTNMILLFNSKKSTPEKAYKVDSVAGFSISNGKVVVIDKFFEYVNLDTEKKVTNEKFPEKSYTEKIAKAPGEKNGLVQRYSQWSELKWLEEAVSHNLPSSEVFFAQIVIGPSKAPK